MMEMGNGHSKKTKTKRGFSPVTILFIAAIAAVVLIAFVTLQQYAGVNKPGAGAAFSQVKKAVYEESVKAGIVIAKSIAGASIALGETGGIAPEKYWYCNAANPPTLEQLSLSLCEKAKEGIGGRSENRSLSDGTNVNVSEPGCVDAQVFDEGIVASARGWQAVVENEKENATVDFKGTKVEVNGNRLGYVFRRMGEWTNSTQGMGVGFCSLLDSPCQARKCVYEQDAAGIISQATLQSLQVKEADVRKVVEGIAENLTDDFDDREVSCTYKIDEINYNYTPNYAYSSRDNCACPTVEISNGNDWGAWNGNEIAKPKCTLANDAKPARCGEVYSVSAYYDEPTELGMAEKLGIVVDGCGNPEKECFYASNVLLAYANLSKEQANKIAVSASQGKIVITDPENYEKVKEFAGGPESSAALEQNGQIRANYFTVGDGVVIEGTWGSMVKEEQGFYADLYYSIAANVTNQKFNATRCNETGLAAAQETNVCIVKNQLLSLEGEGGVSTTAFHEMVGLKRSVEVKFTLVCTDSKYNIVTEEGMKQLVFKAKYYVKIEKNCPPPKEC
ncbi:Uncharacterised protein [Candidatus Gugararchaeum adminiculabundum]|nr:Uncharacterised protein [Candidatus Gugararchaeum adminiculabundum]